MLCNVQLIRTTNKNYADENLRIQREMIKDFVLEKGWELTCVYSDISSGIDKNKNLKLMIEDARQGKFDIIVTTEPSRLLRSSTKLSTEIECLRKTNKIHIVTVDNQINTIHSDDDKLLRNFSSFNNVLQQKNMRFPAVYIRTNKPLEENRYLQNLIALIEYKKIVDSSKNYIHLNVVLKNICQSKINNVTRKKARTAEVT